MVSSAEQPLRKAMAEARDAGIEKADLISMVTDVYNAPQVSDRPPGGTPAVNGSRRLPLTKGEVIYDEPPGGLIDLRTAAEKYGCSVGRLRQWVKRGHLLPQGRLKARAPGGGVVLVDDSLVQRLLLDPPKNGRPKTVLD